MSSGTHQEIGQPITDEDALELWAIVDAHAPRGGICPVCRRARRCWTRALAVEKLILTGRYREPRPTG